MDKEFPGDWKAGFFDEQKWRKLNDLDDVFEVFEGRKGVVWLAVVANDLEQTHEYLAKTLGLNELAVEDALSTNERPSLTQLEDVVFLEFVIPSDDRLSEISAFVGEHYVITVTKQTSCIIDEWFEKWSEHPTDYGKSPYWILHTVMDAAVDSYFPICDELEDEVDKLEEAVFRSDGQLIGKALSMKRRVLRLRRGIAPARDVLNELLRLEAEEVPKDVRPYFQDVYDHTLRLMELLEINREILAGILDAHLSMVSNRLNQTMQVLTVGATYLMTAGLVTGIYGMNFKHMPELDWRYGYPGAIALIVVLIVAEHIFFKRRGWF